MLLAIACNVLHKTSWRVARPSQSSGSGLDIAQHHVTELYKMLAVDPSWWGRCPERLFSTLMEYWVGASCRGEVQFCGADEEHAGSARA